MIKEQYVAYSTACLLKEKGFDEKCKGFYSKKKGQVGKFKFWEGDGLSHSDFKDWDYEVMVSAPTLQMAHEWLIERNICIEVSPCYEPAHIDEEGNFIDECEIWEGWYHEVCLIDPCRHLHDDLDDDNRKPYKTHAKALEAGIKYALKHYIETPYVERD